MAKRNPDDEIRTEMYGAMDAEEIRRLRQELAYAQRERDESRAESDAMSDDFSMALRALTAGHANDCLCDFCAMASKDYQSFAKPLLDRLHRAEALIAKWKAPSVKCCAEHAAMYAAYETCADELGQALKGEPHA